MRLFLTGGTGMVGRNILETVPPSVTIIAPPRALLDLTDAAAVHAAFTQVSPDFVIHAAGMVGGIAANIADPAGFLAQNVRMGLNVLESADRLGIPCLNLASSCIYPPEAPNPLKEHYLLTGGLEPTNEGYALAKLAVLRFGQYLNKASGQSRIKSLIPCNIYGRYDHFDPLTSHLIPAVILKVHLAKQDGGQVEIWGDGSARREFLYAGDLAKMIWHAVACFEALPDVMNLGFGRDYTVLEYYQAVAEVIGWTGEFHFDIGRPVGMKRKLVDISWQRTLGFPTPMPLAQGIAETYRFFRETHSS